MSGGPSVAGSSSQLSQAVPGPQQLNQSVISPQQPPWYRPNQVPVRAIQIQQQQKAAAHAQPATYEPRAPLSRQLSGASAVTASTTASSGHPGHASGYDTSTTHRSSSSSTDSLASTSSREGIEPARPTIVGPGRGVAGLQAVELRRVRTLYACVGEHEAELSFEPNQIITNVRPSLEPGWLEGNLEGRVGLVPQNYVEYVP